MLHLLFLLWLLQPVPTQVFLTYDTEPVDTPAQVEAILTTLDARDAHATFFVTGEFAADHPKLVRRIAERHEVACHSVTHPRLTRVDDKQLWDEVAGCKNIVERITGIPVMGFRAPYLAMDARVPPLLAEAGYVYDASMLDYQTLPDVGVRELPVSSVGMIPVMDYIFLHLSPVKGLGRWVLEHRRGTRVAICLHPRFAVEETGRLLDAYGTSQALGKSIS